MTADLYLPRPVLGESTNETLANAMKVVVHISAQLEWLIISEPERNTLHFRELLSLCYDVSGALQHEWQIRHLPPAEQCLARDRLRVGDT